MLLFSIRQLLSFSPLPYDMMPPAFIATPCRFRFSYLLRLFYFITLPPFRRYDACLFHALLPDADAAMMPLPFLSMPLFTAIFFHYLMPPFAACLLPCHLLHADFICFFACCHAACCSLILMPLLSALPP